MELCVVNSSMTKKDYSFYRSGAPAFRNVFYIMCESLLPDERLAQESLLATDGFEPFHRSPAESLSTRRHKAKTFSGETHRLALWILVR